MKAHSTMPPADRQALREALVLLASAYYLGRELDGDGWQCAIELSYLESIGISRPVVCWLVVRGLARHGYDVTKAGQL